MFELWLDITDLPASGREFSFSDQTIWTGPIAEFKLPHRLADADAGFSATLSVTPQGRGMLVTGHIGGTVITPCDRCADDTFLVVDSAFELYEELPIEGEQSLEPTLLRRRGKILELDAATLLWEQLLLALPIKPLCDEACPGLCPQCGKALREGPCGCAVEEGDTRLAVLKNLKVPRGSN